MIIRGDNFLLPGPEGDHKPERLGFYVVRTTVADERFAAGRLALFDFETELRVAQKLDGRFLETGSLAVEEVHPLDDNEEEVSSGLFLYPMS